MKGWNIRKLKDVCEYVTVGFVGTMAEHYRPSGVLFLRSLNIKPFKLNFDDVRYIEESFHQAIKKSSLLPGDVAVVRTGYPGTACVIPKSLPVSNCSDLVIVRPGPELNPHYLAAIFNSAFGRDLVAGNLVGAAQQHFNVTVAKELKLLMPARKVQDKIAAILSAYDGLIANNQRRVMLLERMAEDIYREWFVRLRFPGRQGLKIEKGVPDGWQLMPSNEAFEVLGGGTPNTETPVYWDGQVPFFTPKDATGNFYVLTTEKSISEKGLVACSSQLFPKNTIFITARGTVGKLALASRPMAMNQSCYALRPKQSALVYFHYLAIRESITYIKGVSKSGVFDNIVMDTFKNVPMLVPPNDLLERFNKLTEPFFVQVGNLLVKNDRLKATRDTLLPRLISGKLAVDALDIRFPPEMAANE